MWKCCQDFRMVNLGLTNKGPVKKYMSWREGENNIVKDKAFLFMEGCQRPANLKRVVTWTSFLLFPEQSCCVSVVWGRPRIYKFTLLLGGRLSRSLNYSEVQNLVTIHKKVCQNKKIHVHERNRTFFFSKSPLPSVNESAEESKWFLSFVKRCKTCLHSPSYLNRKCIIWYSNFYIDVVIMKQPSFCLHRCASLGKISICQQREGGSRECHSGTDKEASEKGADWHSTFVFRDCSVILLV